MLNLWTRPRRRGLVGLIAAACVLTTGVTTASQAAPAPAVRVPAAVAPAKDATLKSLAVVTPKKIALAPKFSAARTKYTATVPVGTKKVVFKAVPKQPKAKAVVALPKTFKDGPNKVTITVTAPDKKTKKVYTVTVIVLKASTVSIVPGTVTVVPGGVSLKIKVVNASILPVITTVNSTACAKSVPYPLVGQPDVFNVVQVLVQGVAKGCQFTLSFTVKPRRGYAPAKVLPVTLTPTQDKAGFARGKFEATDDGFRLEYKLFLTKISCKLSAYSPANAVLAFDDTSLRVSGLATTQSATVVCTFEADPGTIGLEPEVITGSPLTQALLVVSPPQKLEDGFSVVAAANGCVPTAVFDPAVPDGSIDVGEPVKGRFYTITVSGLLPGKVATIVVSCPGLTGLFYDADPWTQEGQAANGNELGLVAAPRVADGTDFNLVTYESDLPDVQDGYPASMLYATSPEWSPWSETAGKNTYDWQISVNDYDEAGVGCNDPKYNAANWARLPLKVSADSAQWMVAVGDLVAQNPEYFGRCVRVKVTGSYGSRTGTAFSPAVALASSEPPSDCAELPQLSGSTDSTYAVAGDDVTTTMGRCSRGLGLLRTVKWQVSDKTLPSSDSDWEDLPYTTETLSVPTLARGKWLRSQVTYSVYEGVDVGTGKPIWQSTVLVSPVMAVAGSTIAPSLVAGGAGPAVSGGGVGLLDSQMAINLGDWKNAAAAALTITWQFCAADKECVDLGDWEDQTVIDNATGEANPASLVFYAKSIGKYRAVITFSSQTGAFSDVVVTTDSVDWSATS